MEKGKGTSAVLRQTRLYEELVAERGEHAAGGLMVEAFQESLPNSRVTKDDIISFMKVTEALRTGAIELPSLGEVGAERAFGAAKHVWVYFDEISN